MDNNLSAYKFLRAKSQAKKRSVFDFDRTMENLMEGLIPSRGAAGKSPEDGSAEDMEALAEEYDKKLQLIEKNQDKRFGEMSEVSQKEMERLSKQVQQGDEQNLELSDSLKSAIEKLAGRGQQGEQQGEQEQSTEEEPQEESPEDDGLAIPEYAGAPAQQKAPTTAKTAVTRMAKKLVSINDTIAVGDNSYKVTNTFGQRTGKNAVSGVSEQEHSRGVDLVGFSKDGKISNLPIALTDGEILSVNLQGSGEPVNPKDARAAGYYMNVKMPDGKIMKYMHLGEDAWKNKAQLVGKKISRGDILYQGDYSRGSGSQTGPHIKVSISSVDSSGKELRDFSAPENDPTPYALYGSYVEEY